MKKSDKIISFVITVLISVVFITIASLFAMNYNAWFVSDKSDKIAAACIASTPLLKNMCDKLAPDGKSYFYEAFPILSGNADNDRGFSVRISKYELANDDYEAFVHVGDEFRTKYTKLKIGA